MMPIYYALVAALAVCAGARAQDIPSDSVAGVALTVPDLSVLVDAAVATDLVGALSDPDAELTVFAPTNDAFVALLGALGADGLDDLPVDLVTDVLLYHVVPAAALSTDLTDGMVLPTLGGGELTVDLSDGVMIDGVGSSASVIAADVEAGSSVVHVIDTVLLPFAVGGAAPEMEPEMEPEEEELSVAALASLVPDLSILVEAAVAADLVGALSDPESGFTVFAPTNDGAFRETPTERGRAAAEGGAKRGRSTPASSGGEWSVFRRGLNRRPPARFSFHRGARRARPVGPRRRAH